MIFVSLCCHTTELSEQQQLISFRTIFHYVFQNLWSMKEAEDVYASLKNQGIRNFPLREYYIKHLSLLLNI